MYHKLIVPTLGVVFRRCSVRAVLPSNWEHFIFPQEELQDSQSVSSDQLPSPTGLSRTTYYPAQPAKLSSSSLEPFKKQTNLHARSAKHQNL